MGEESLTSLHQIVKQPQVDGWGDFNKPKHKITREYGDCLSSIINMLPDPTLVVDSEGKVVAWNRAMEDLTGIRAEDMVGRGDFEYALPFYGTRSPMLINKVLGFKLDTERYLYYRREKESLVAEGIVTSLAGRKRWLWGKASPLIDSEGNMIGAIETIRDITEYKEMESQVVRLDKLESLSLLAGGIAHDFKNILTIILGNVQLLYLMLSEGEFVAGADVWGLLEETEKAALQAREITDQLLALYKEGLPVNKGFVSVADLIRKASAIALRGSNVDCEYDIQDDLWKIEADSSQLCQVITNLVINARQAMPLGGTIFISARNVILDESSGLPLPKGSYILIEVRDEGIGISENDLDKIFDPYFSTKREGTGLGLTICHAIVRNHGGCITVDSWPGIGSVFYVYLPALPEGPSVVSSQGVPLQKGQGRILLVDDVEGLRNTARDMIRWVGYEVDVALDGKHALNLYEKALGEGNPYDAVIMDLTIPGGMGGAQAVRKLLELHPEAKVILSTGYAYPQIARVYQSWGFRAFLAKPYTLTELSQVLKQVLSDSPVKKYNA